MDTKIPRILQKYHEKLHQGKKESKQTEVFLPPLISLPTRQQGSKIPGTPQSRGPPYISRPQEYQQERPYRVLPIGATPLMYACQQGNKARVLKLLKEQGDTTDYRDRTLRNTLHYCMDAGTGGAVAASAPELVNAPDAEGHTPLHLAVIAGDTELVAVLLANGADVNAKDLEGHSTLHWATVCGEAKCVRLVLMAGARPSTPDLRGGSPLHYAAQCCGLAATAELAVPKKVGLNVLQTLLEFGADVNAKDKDGRQPILWAASAGSVEAVLALARADESTVAVASDKDGLTALHCAASRGHARCVEVLVNLCGSQPDNVDDNGCLALHYSATLGHADATALLLRLGSDPNRQDRKGRTPVLCAAAKGQLETLKILAQYGGSLYIKSIRGTGVAHEAVTSGRIEMIKWLSKKYPSTLDVATHDGRTPLHVAALYGHLDACKILLDHGARFNAVLRTSKGNLMTALDTALYKGHRDCAKLIQMYGGTTAYQLSIHKTTPHKVFAAKLHLKHIGSSTDSDSSPGRRRGKYSNWELPISYNKHCNERRTRRKGNLATLDRRNSRSCSEEVKLSKKDHGRRTRSESVRYDSESNGEQIKQRKSKRRLNRYKHDYDESSTESAGQNYSDHTTVRTILRKTNRRMIPEDEKTNERVKDKENASSVSNDSLEVVIVRSVEKKTEKVVSERRSKTPRKASKGETVLLKNQDNLRNKSKTESVIEESIEVVDKTCSSKLSRMNLNESKKSKRSEERLHTKSAVQDDSEEEEESIARQKTIHQRDMTDSTSQETVEYVTVTAMVHKHQTPDIPKSTSKERTLKSHQKEKKEAKNQKENLEYLKIMRPQSARLTITNKFRISSGNSKINNILERANKMHSTLMLKAVDFKKEVEEKCHVSQEFHQDELTGNIESRIKEVEKEKRDDNFVVLDKVHEFINEIISEEIINGATTVKGRKFIKVETMDISSEDSQKECSRLSSQTEETSSLKAGKDFLNEKISMEGEINISAKFLKNSVKDEQVNSKNMENTKNSPSFESFKSENVSILPVSKKERDKVKIQHERDSTPRTVVEDVPASDIENEPDRQDQETKSSATLIASKDTFSLNSKKSECIQKSPSKLSEAEDKIYIDEKKGKTQVKCGFHKEHTERISIMSNLKKTPTTRKATDDTSDGRTLKCIDKINRDRTSTTKEFRNERKAETLAEKTLPRSIDKFHDGSVEYRIEEITQEKCEDLFQNTTEEKRIKVSSKDDEPIAICTNKYDDKEFVCKISEVADFQANKEKKLSEIEGDEEVKHLMMKESDSNISSDEDLEIRKALILQPENFQFIDDSSTERNTLDSSTSIRLTRCLKQSTRNNNRRRRSSKSPMKKTLIESSKEYLPDQSAIVAVIDSSEWDEDEDNGINREIRKAVGEDVEHDTEPEEDNNNEVVRISSSMNEGETPRTATSVSKTTGADSLPQVHLRLQPRLPRTQSPQNNRHTESRIRHRRNSGGRDSGIEPSPRISRIPKRTTKCYLSTEKQRTLNMETVTRDVQISLRRYYLERKIFFQLMELKRLQIRHGRANEQVLIKRQVEAFHKAGATGPTLGVAKYDQPLTFRHFEAFLYEQLRQLQRRSTFPNWCTEAKQCTQKTYRCHHATSAYTSVPVYTYRRL